MGLDPNKKYLIQIKPGNPKESGTIYSYNAQRAARKDMRPYDPVKKRAISDIPVHATEEGKEQIELRGNTYNVSPELNKVLIELREHVEQIESANRILKDQVVALKEKNDELTANIPGETDPVIEGDQNDTPAPYSVVDAAPGWYNVVDNSTDKVMNDKKLRKDEAEGLIKKLESE